MLDETERHWHDDQPPRDRPLYETPTPLLWWIIAALLVAMAFVLIAAPSPAPAKAWEQQNITHISKSSWPRKKFYDRIAPTEDWPTAGREMPPPAPKGEKG